jgi:hypothetical protein
MRREGKRVEGFWHQSVRMNDRRKCLFRAKVRVVWGLCDNKS